MSNLKIYSIGKKLSERAHSWYTWQSRNSGDSQMALRNDHFVDRTFRRSNRRSTEQLVEDC